jgi:hypothetical protein
MRLDTGAPEIRHGPDNLVAILKLTSKAQATIPQLFASRSASVRATCRSGTRA